MNEKRIDYKELAQRLRDEGASEHAIWMAEHAQEIEDAVVEITEREFLATLLPQSELPRKPTGVTCTCCENDPCTNPYQQQ